MYDMTFRKKPLSSFVNADLGKYCHSCVKITTEIKEDHVVFTRQQ